MTSTNAKLPLLVAQISSCSSDGNQNAIKDVDLSNSGLSEFPLTELWPLRDTLETLNLGGNLLSSLPPELSSFTKLRVLFFAQNNFKEIPSVLGSMSSLYMISFKSNQLVSVPPTSLSPSLGWLILTDNKIAALPSTIGRLVGLRKCMLAANELSSLPTEMANCKQLELLRIAANKLTLLPDWLLRLPKLSWLAFAGNPLCAESALSTGGGSDALANLRAIDYTDLSMGEKIGEGASGVVYKALLGEDELAVKIFKSGATSDGLPEDEMQAMLAAGAHENCVQVFGRVVNAPAGQLGLVLPLLPPSHKILGNPPSFQSVTRDTFSPTSRFNISTIIRIARGIASVCAHLHSRGISHGDLYAHNTLVDPGGTPTLSDFGAASFYSAMPSDVRDSLQGIEVRAFGCLLEDLLERVDLPDASGGSGGGDGGGGSSGVGDDETARIESIRQVKTLCIDGEPSSRPRFALLQTLLTD